MDSVLPGASSAIGYADSGRLSAPNFIDPDDRAGRAALPAHVVPLLLGVDGRIVGIEHWGRATDDVLSACSCRRGPKVTGLAQQHRAPSRLGAGMAACRAAPV